MTTQLNISSDTTSLKLESSTDSEGLRIEARVKSPHSSFSAVHERVLPSSKDLVRRLGAFEEEKEEELIITMSEGGTLELTRTSEGDVDVDFTIGCWGTDTRLTGSISVDGEGVDQLLSDLRALLGEGAGA